jgi:long-chain acyl-CoA synthetase
VIGGEYAAAEMLTQAIEGARFIGQLFVYGDSPKTYLVGIVVPSREAIAEFLGRERISESECAEACSNEGMRRAILEEMAVIATAKGLMEFQRLRGIYVDSTAWTPDNDLLTPTFKIRIRALSEYSREKIDELYRRSS